MEAAREEPWGQLPWHVPVAMLLTLAGLASFARLLEPPPTSPAWRPLEVEVAEVAPLARGSAWPATAPRARPADRPAVSSPVEPPPRRDLPPDRAREPRPPAPAPRAAAPAPEAPNLPSAPAPPTSAPPGPRVTVGRDAIGGPRGPVVAGCGDITGRVAAADTCAGRRAGLGGHFPGGCHDSARPDGATRRPRRIEAPRGRRPRRRRHRGAIAVRSAARLRARRPPRRRPCRGPRHLPTAARDPRDPPPPEHRDHRGRAIPGSCGRPRPGGADRANA